MCRGEEARQGGVLREREHAAIDEERLGFVERVELAVRREAAVVEPLLAQVGHGAHAGKRGHGRESIAARRLARVVYLPRANRLA